MITTTAVEELKKELATRKDVPQFFPIRIVDSKVVYTQHEEDPVWCVERDKGGLYPTEESFLPYLEKV